MKKKILFASFAILFFVGCCKIIIINDEELRLSFVGYSYEEIDSFYIIFYEKNSNFQTALDSNLITVDSNHFSFLNDTALYFGSLPFGESDIEENKYDLKIKNIYDNKEIEISEIKYVVSDYKTGCTIFTREKHSYISALTSFKQDNTVHLNENMVYFKK